MDLERSNIEKRDFPASRKGYDRDEVDRHLRAVAEAVDRLRAAPPTASVAGATAQRVETIVAAAEASAREIEERARADADAARRRGAADAAAHIGRAEEAADGLVARAAELQEQVAVVMAQLEGLRSGVESMRAELDAAAPEPAAAAPPAPEPVVDLEPDPEPEPEPVALQAVPDPEPEPAPAAAKSAPAAPEGARLIALNMALSGTPREETARYLRDNYDLDDSDQLLDDVYAKAGG